MANGNYRNSRTGRYSRTELETFVPAGTVVTATGVVTGSTLELGDRANMRARLTWTAHAGSGAATVAVQTAETVGGTYTTVATFTATSGATGSERKLFGPLDRFVRVNVTAFSGTSVTLGVVAETL